MAHAVSVPHLDEANFVRYKNFQNHRPHLKLLMTRRRVLRRRRKKRSAHVQVKTKVQKVASIGKIRLAC